MSEPGTILECLFRAERIFERLRIAEAEAHGRKMRLEFEEELKNMTERQRMVGKVLYDSESDQGADRRVQSNSSTDDCAA